MAKPKSDVGVIVRVIESTPTELSGLYKQPFKLHLNTDLLRPGDQLVPTTTKGPYSGDNEQVLIIQSTPEALGKGYLYKVCHTFLDRNLYYHPKYLAKDCEFEYVGNRFPSLAHWDMWILDYVKIT